jgi:hypothetical protein
MTWAKIETGYLANQKVLRLSAQATLLHLASVLWSHDQETDGWVPEHVIPLLCAHAHGASPHDAEMLSSLGLWEAGPGGYWVHDFLRHQDSAATRENEREQARERQRKRRESQEVSRRDIGRESRNREEKRREERDKEPPLPPTNETVVDLPTKPRARRQAPSGECDPEFQEWYALYPRKEAPKDAAKAWVQMRRDASAEDIIAGLHRALPDLEAKKPARGERDFRPLPASWLRAGRWLDEVGESKQPKGESKLCGKCDQYAFKGSGRCGNGQTVAQIAETAQIIEQPEIEVCRGWEWIRDGREEPAVGRVLRVDHRRA